ncbi:MAG: Flp pilus assembly protein CpaB [Aquabacterium sp.]
MNNTVLKVIAALLALGAVAVAVIGIKLSQQPAGVSGVAPAASAPMESVIVAARPIQAGRMLTRSDVVTKSVQSPPPLSFRALNDTLGKVATTDIPTGTPLQPSQFLTGVMSALLRPGERALAISVNEVTGMSGHLRPGDLVDIVAYSSGSPETQAFAQIAAPKARLLSIGPISQMDLDEQRAEHTAADAKQTAPATPRKANDFPNNMRSAVVAIPAHLVTRVTLLTESGGGSVKLVLRPLINEEGDASADRAEGATAVETAGSAPGTVTFPEVAPSAKRPQSQLSRKPSTTVIIQEGSKERRLEVETPDRQP